MEVGKRRANFLVENQVVMELKAAINLENVHLVQAKNFMEAYKYTIGMLIDFGAETYNLSESITIV